VAPAPAHVTPDWPTRAANAAGPTNAESETTGSLDPLTLLSILRRETHLGGTFGIGATPRGPGRASPDQAGPPVGESGVAIETPDLPEGQMKPAVLDPAALLRRGSGADARELAGLADTASHTGPNGEGGLPDVLAQGAAADIDALSTPALGTSPTRQLAASIADSLATTTQASSTGPAPAEQKSAGTQVLKVLTVQLHPAELGTVTVRLALRNDALELQIEAGRHDTARLINADRDALCGILRSAGYGVETLTERAIDPTRASSLAAAPQGQHDTGAHAQAGGYQGAGTSGGRHGQQDSASHGTRMQADNERRSQRSGDGDGLYV
jgi:chemotaxis protein MotD